MFFVGCAVCCVLHTRSKRKEASPFLEPMKITCHTILSEGPRSISGHWPGLSSGESLDDADGWIRAKRDETTSLLGGSSHLVSG